MKGVVQAENHRRAWPPSSPGGGFALRDTRKTHPSPTATKQSPERSNTLSCCFQCGHHGCASIRLPIIACQANAAYSLLISCDNRPSINLSVYGTFAGKVHGSLARAGKVRGQAPKVAKQDKKKLPRGRAKKRLQYNRRFVNVGASAPAVFCSYAVTSDCLHHTACDQDDTSTILELWTLSLECMQCMRVAKSTVSHCLCCNVVLVCAVTGMGKKKGPNAQ